jgi:hypothetical protein
MNATWPACYHRFFGALAARGQIVAGTPGGRTEWTAQCPAHEDTVRSLSIGRGRSGALVLKCHAPAGCTAEAVTKALGVTLADLYADEEEKRRIRDERWARDAELARAYTSGHAVRYVEDCYRDTAGRQPVERPPVSTELPRELVAPPPVRLTKPKGVTVSTTAPATRKMVKQYDYRDEAGTLLFQCVRYEPKDFRQRRPNPEFDTAKPPGAENPPWLWNLQGVRRVLYRLPELLETWHKLPSKVVFVVEGEKDADLLMAAGLLATTSPMGADKWQDEFTATLKGRHVVVVPDEDPIREEGYSPGLRHAYDVACRVAPVAASLRLLRLPGLPPKGDVSDWWTLNADPGITLDAVKAKLGGLVKACPLFDPAAPPPPGARSPEAAHLPGITPGAAAPQGTIAATAVNVQSASPPPASPPPASPPPVSPPPAPPVAPPPPPAPGVAAAALQQEAHDRAKAAAAHGDATGLGAHPNVQKLLSHAMAAGSALRDSGVKVTSVAQLYGMLRLVLGRIERASEECVFTGNTDAQQRQLGHAVSVFAGILVLAAADSPVPLETGTPKATPAPTPAGR